MSDRHLLMARTMVASIALAEASQTIGSLSNRARRELDESLARSRVAIATLAAHGAVLRRTLFRVLSDNERLALEWDAQQQRTIDLAKELERARDAVAFLSDNLASRG